MPAPTQAPFCHSLIKETAQSLARNLYEKLALKNDFFAVNPKEAPFVEKMWPVLIEDARATLVNMLSLPYPEELKEQIADAIIKDNTLTRGRPDRVASRLRTGQSGRLQ